MKFFTNLLLFSFLLTSCSPTGVKDPSITCIAKWRKGDERVFEITRTKESHSSTSDQRPFKMSYEAHILVLDSSAEGYKIKWTFQLPENIRKSRPAFAESLPVYNGMEMIFTTTPSGVFKELLNWEKVKDAYAEMMLASVPRDLDDSIRALLDKSIAVFNSRDVAEETLIREIRIFHSPFGIHFTSGEQKRDTAFVANGDSLHATVIKKVLDADSKDEELEIRMGLQLDSLSAYNMLGGLFKKMGIPQDKVVAEAESKLGELKIADESTYRIIRSSGWLTTLKYTRTARTSAMNQVETFVFTLIGK